MKAVLQYRATPGFRAAIAALESDWLRIAVVDETDRRRSRAKCRTPTFCSMSSNG